MKILIKARPGAREEKVEKVDDENYIVSVKERAEDNEANIAIIKALSEYFKVSMLQVRLIGGRTSRHKVIVIDGL